jgi:hypothetical protein
MSRGPGLNLDGGTLLEKARTARTRNLAAPRFRCGYHPYFSSTPT